LKNHPKTIRRLIILVLLLTVVSLGVWSVFVEPNRLVIHSETLSIKGWPSSLDGLRIAAIGDIHGGSPFIRENKLRDIVALTNAQHPDLVVLLGDYMVRDQFYRSQLAPEQMTAILKDLKAPLGVYAVLGNHDWYFDGERVRKAFETDRIKILENESAELRDGDQSIALVGLADAWTRPQDIDGTIANAPIGIPVIAITHNPDIFVQLPSRVSLLLAAHTHGGQVNLPIVGRLVVPSNYGQKYAAGHVEENGKHLFVTTGIGTSILPLRFRVPPEIAILTIRSQ
jgi:predicted MPP superfamily phosphohydrolase